MNIAYSPKYSDFQENQGMALFSQPTSSFWLYLPKKIIAFLLIMGKRIKWLILPLHESETDRHLIGLSG
jgi:hypothetical protein